MHWWQLFPLFLSLFIYIYIWIYYIHVVACVCPEGKENMRIKEGCPVISNPNSSGGGESCLTLTTWRGAKYSQGRQRHSRDNTRKPHPTANHRRLLLIIIIIIVSKNRHKCLYTPYVIRRRSRAAKKQPSSVFSLSHYPATTKFTEDRFE